MSAKTFSQHPGQPLRMYSSPQPVEQPLHTAMSRSDALVRLGVTELEDALGSGALVEVWPGVVVPGDQEHDPRTRAAAALLRAGPAAVLSGLTAAAMHGCRSAADSAIEVTVSYDRQLRCLPGLSVRQAWIRESDVLELDGLRVFALEVVLAELLCTGPQRMALACVEEALGGLSGAARPSAAHLRSLIAERIARRRDRRGTRKAVALLELAWDSPQQELAC